MFEAFLRDRAEPLRRGRGGDDVVRGRNTLRVCRRNNIRGPDPANRVGIRLHVRGLKKHVCQNIDLFSWPDA